LSSWIDRLIKRPYTVISLLGIFLFLGLYGYNAIDRKLFPDSNRPEIAVVIQWPGAGAKDIASNVAVPVERELYTIDKVRRVSSTTIDEVTVIRAEFEYSKDIDSAANDVTNAITKIRSLLPPAVREPRIYKITAATPPVVVIGVRGGDLMAIRELLENEVKNRLLKLPLVSNVDIFGGYRRELLVKVDRGRLEALGLTVSEVFGALAKGDRDFAIGSLNLAQGRFLLKSKGKRELLEEVKRFPIRPGITLGDVAHLSYSHYDNTALYFGNGRPAIALAIQRGTEADVIRTIDMVEEELERIRASYPHLQFEVTDTQRDTIQQSITNMFESLRDAIVMSTIVAFFFLASLRQVLVVLFTIPLVYAATIAGMYLLGIEFSVVTLTAIILALGLLLDDAVVVMENIERHYRELGKPIEEAVIEGTKEIMFADLSGTVTTMAALIPIMFVGDYPQTIFRPLVGTLLIALAASYFISITTVPLLSLKFLAIKNPALLRFEEWFRKISDSFNSSARSLFKTLARKAMERRVIALSYFILLLSLFIVAAKSVMPLVGQELMPPMDTGIVKVTIQMDSNLPIEKSGETVEQVSRILREVAPLVRMSATVGSEPGVISMGSGSGIDSIGITATYVNRFQRSITIWEIERKIRERIAQLPNIKEFTVFDYGATALSSIRGNVDVMLSADDFRSLDEAAEKIYQVLLETKGLVDVARSWRLDKIVYTLKIDEERALFYGLTPSAIASQLALYLKGGFAATQSVQNGNDLPIRVWGDNRRSIEDFLLTTPKGRVPLEAVAEIREEREPSSITREGLQYTVNVYGFREKAAISHIMANFDGAVKGVELPPGVTMEQMGDIAQFSDSAKRMVKAVLFGVLLIFFVLVPLFSSFKAPLLIILSIPLTLIGAAWILLLLDYHTSMPAMMGFILLSGIIVNNAILLIEFALMGLERGLTPQEAMLESIDVRTRPVLMTAFATTAGMLPVALGWAIGLERLAPLGAVAIGGLIVGTFLTLVFIPILFTWIYRGNTSLTGQ